METKFQETIKDMKSFLENEAKTETIIGKEFELGEFKCVPVMSLGLGIGGGEMGATKQGQGESGGAAAGMGIAPVGFLVARGDQIQFVSSKPSHGLGIAFEKLPDLLSKYFDSQKKPTN